MAILLIVVCVLAAYSDSLHGPFIFDDVPDIVANEALRAAWPSWRPIVDWKDGRLKVHPRPVVVLSFAANYAATGLNVFYFHITNLAIHVLAGLTLYGIARRTLSLPGMRDFQAAAQPLALLIALLWTLHPLQTGAVTYIVQRYESMMGLFYFATLYCFVRAATSERRSTSWAIACVASCLLAMGCKEVAVSAPLIVLLYDRAFISGRFSAAWRAHQGVYLGLFATWMIFGPIYLHVSGGAGPHGAGGVGFAGEMEDRPWRLYALNQPAVILHYLRLTFWPQGQCFDYLWRATRDPLRLGPPIAIISCALAATISATLYRPKLGFLGDWFFCILAPSSSFIPINDLAFEHRMYLPLAAVDVGVVLGGYWLYRRYFATRSAKARGLLLGVPIAVVALLSAATFFRNRVYADHVTAWQDVVAKSPENPRAIFALACSLSEAGRDREAVSYLEILRRQDFLSEYPEYQREIGVLLMQLHEGGKAIPHFLNALRLDPEAVYLRLNLAATLASGNYLEAALAELQLAIALQPRLTTSTVAAADGKIAEQRRLVEFVAQARHVEPAKLAELPVNLALARYETGLALLQADALPDALNYFNAAEKLRPEGKLAEPLRRAIAETKRRLGDPNRPMVGARH